MTLACLSYKERALASLSLELNSLNTHSYLTLLSLIMSVHAASFRKELAQTAQAIVAKGKGILAADESPGTIGKTLRVKGRMSFK